MEKEELVKLRNLVSIQGQKGNWDYNEYMLGLYNGMELMLAVIEEREPIYKDKPKKWNKISSDDLKHFLGTVTK